VNKQEVLDLLQKRSEYSREQAASAAKTGALHMAHEALDLAEALLIASDVVKLHGIGRPKYRHIVQVDEIVEHPITDLRFTNEYVFRSPKAAATVTVLVDHTHLAQLAQRFQHPAKGEKFVLSLTPLAEVEAE